MPVSIDEFASGGAPGISGDRLNEPFHVSDAAYDSGTDTLTVTVGRGRFQPTPHVVVEFSADETLDITPVTVSTTYYIFLAPDGTLNSAEEQTGGTGVLLGSVATGVAKSTLTRTDLRGMLPVPFEIDPVRAHLLHYGWGN